MIFCSFKRFVRNRNFNRFRKRFLNIGNKEGMVTYDAAFMVVIPYGMFGNKMTCIKVLTVFLGR